MDGADKHRGGEDPGTAAILKWWMATALTRTRFGSNEVTAQVANLAYSPGRPIRRLQRLLSSPN